MFVNSLYCLSLKNKDKIKIIFLKNVKALFSYWTPFIISHKIVLLVMNSVGFYLCVLVFLRKQLIFI